jgi:hypothetical protein
MKKHLVAPLCLIVILGAAAQGIADECPLGHPAVFARLGAYAAAGGRIADGVGPEGCDVGPLSASTHEKSPDEQLPTLYDGMAQVVGSTLKVKAQAAMSEDSSGFSVEGNAVASWGDVLSLDDSSVHIVGRVSRDAFATIAPRVEGQVFNGFMSFHAYVADENGMVFMEDSIERSFDGFSGLPPDDPNEPGLPDEVKQTFTDGYIPFVIPLEKFLDGVLFHMDLGVSATALEPGQFARSDFSHTAFLPTIRIVDADGNPFPELAGISVQFVGSSGQTYAASTTVPEPTSATILAIGMLLVMSCNRRRP